MKIAILSDIHGNLSSLDAVLVDLDARGGADQIVALGDVVAMGPQPSEVIARLRERDCVIVQGNTDTWFAPGRPPEPSPKKARDKREERILRLYHWLKDELRPEDHEFLNALPFSYEVATGAERLWFVHGSPRQNNEAMWPITPDDALHKMLKPAHKAGVTLVACGHTHQAMVRVLDSITVVNPGVVGTRGNGDVRAAYGILAVDDTSVRVELCRIAYDPSPTIAAAEARDFPMPRRYARKLREGVEML
ncbi:MAG: metallophosphatase family protein [Chloroflexi bacterium]|nr:metallophosphatase family protein [Chloroflexota bacterium]MBU1750478.1 metallophosphatase family protein [Chloroflexota bacterium]MBU1879835.1 metallophosphatase family protein [Chloroflexota bacterium]